MICTKTFESRLGYLYLIPLLLAFNFGLSQNGGPEMTFYDKEHFLIEGTEIDEALKESPYDRLPSSYKTKVRELVWNLSKNSAGISIRFHSNSTRIAVRWTLFNDNSMNHMAGTGIKGIDLYAKNELGQWQYVNTARPSGKENESLIVENMSLDFREFKMYLPLYDGVTKLEVGIDTNANIKKAAPNTKKPIVFYGTSITQGGCASRTGMAHTNIISRKLDRDVINFGFSGNGKMEAPITELISEIDAEVLIIECLPNMKKEEIAERTAPLVHALRKKRPETPILLVENFIYENSFFDQDKKALITAKNNTLKQAYDKLVADGTKKLYYIDSKGAMGLDHEGTVDGVHFTDLGFLRYADFLVATMGELGVVGQ